MLATMVDEEKRGGKDRLTGAAILLAIALVATFLLTVYLLVSAAST